MPENNKESKSHVIEFFIGIAVRAPIEADDYQVGNATINVSYPKVVDFGFPTPISLPQGLSTVFVVKWNDKAGKTQQMLSSKSFQRHLPIYKAIESINELLIAFKLVRIGHSDGSGIRTVGKSDTLFYFSKVDGVPTKDLNMGLKIYGRDYPWAAGANKSHDDPHQTTVLAKPHIASDSYPTARRYVRCFELIEHGFYNESAIVAFSILDDVVQSMLHDLMEKKGLKAEGERNSFLRGIKEQRLKLFLGPVLKLLVGKEIEELWADAPSAIDWVNRLRNKIAHRGYTASYSEAAKVIFACIKVLVILKQHELIEDEFSVEMYRHAKITAAWTVDPQSWIPRGNAAETMEFN